MKAEDQKPMTMRYVYSQKPRAAGQFFENNFEVCRMFKNRPHTEEEKTSWNRPGLMSGGPMIAYFHEEHLASEYCDFKNKQLDDQSKS